MKKRLDEKEIIRVFSDTLGVTDLDDVAVIGRNLVFKTDMLVASTDAPAQMKPWQIARKSIVACASDLAAKGAKPLAAMISLGLPKDITRSYVCTLAKGFQIASKEFGVKIVGGDTNAASELVIDCSMIGTTPNTAATTSRTGAFGVIPRRGGAQPGDIVVASGKFGYPASGLAILLKGARAEGTFRKAAIDSVLLPSPRQTFGCTLARYFSASIDSSDGLAVSLYEIAMQSEVRILVDYNAAKVNDVGKFAIANGLDVYDLVFHGGEEYEIIATIPKSLISRATRAAKRAGCSLQVIGRVEKGSSKVITTDSRLVENRGYMHFS
jgi:thiamine-monophosphate kinase